MLETFKLQTLWYITERSQTNTAPALEDPREAGQTPLQKTICDAEGGKLEKWSRAWAMERGRTGDWWSEEWYSILEFMQMETGTAEPAIWPWDPPDSGQQQRSQMKEASLFWIRPPQKAIMDWNATVSHVSVTGTGCFPRLRWSLCGHTQSVLLPDALVMPLGLAAWVTNLKWVTCAIAWGHAEAGDPCRN